MPSRHLRIGTRGSPMALRQTALVRDRLAAAHPELAANGAVEIVTIRTTGDRVQDRLLAEIGGKGLFVKEIEEGLIAGHIDLAVHSLKDLSSALEFVAYSLGLFHDGHRAASDCQATLSTVFRQRSAASLGDRQSLSRPRAFCDAWVIAFHDITGHPGAYSVFRPDRHWLLLRALEAGYAARYAPASQGEME